MKLMGAHPELSNRDSKAMHHKQLKVSWGNYTCTSYLQKMFMIERQLGGERGGTGDPCAADVLEADVLPDLAEYLLLNVG